MKNLTLIIHTNAKQDLVDRLRPLEEVTGFTFYHVEGQGVKVEGDPFLLAGDKVVCYTPWVRVDILREDADVDAVLDTLGTKRIAIDVQGIY
ncbi:MAG TPA: DUF3240 family protein [Nitrospiria bacterium]|jgi:nitrogen regulatory protein P-II 1